VSTTSPTLRRSAGFRLTVLSLLLLLPGCKVELYTDLKEPEANEIVAALAAEGIAASKGRPEGASWQVEVDEGRMGRALEVLRAQGLPPERFASMGDVFQKQGLVSTPAEERMRYIYAVSQELSQTLRNVDGVVAARVHVVIPANDPLSEKIRPSSAAVFIKYRPDVDMRLLAPAVKEMVAHSIEGLSHEQVSLSLFEARVPADAVAAASAEAAEPLVLGIFPMRIAMMLMGLLFAGAVCVMALPTLLRRQGLDWRSWARRQLLGR
jgi:type III secretion protein J